MKQFRANFAVEIRTVFIHNKKNIEMKKITCYSLLLILFAIVFNSCQEDLTVAVKFAAVPNEGVELSAEQLSGMEVVFTEVRSNDATTLKLNAVGEADAQLTKGVYNVAVEHKMKADDGSELMVSMRIENLSINSDNQLVEGKLNVAPVGNSEQFIFSELFFNGETNSGRMMHPDQYFVIVNNSSQDMYADGLSIGLTQHLSWQEKQMWYDEFYPNNVPCGGFITIPGNGTEHLVKPGEKIVIAMTATDHSSVEGCENAVDLSGADYEVYYGPDSKDVDNPEVPNMILTQNPSEGSYGFFLQPRGYFSSFLFKLENGNPTDVANYFNNNLKKTKHLVPGDADKGTEDEVIEITIFSVATAQILDGVQTSDVPKDIITRVLPETVDRGKFLVSGPTSGTCSEKI